MSIAKYTSHFSTVLIYMAPVMCLIALVGMLNTTNPIEGGPMVILMVFLLLYVLIFTTLAAVLRFVGAAIRIVRPAKQFRLKRWYYVLSVVSLAPVLLVALNTLGQLDILEIILILVLVGLGCFYVLRRIAK